eukprot:CAMPEP_0176105462 /NCGR_PEP_ID=MMETSP0120_2-20121206/52923_1 /TAXON_ID=160619 /ORGANISM="Kryptoperidinium foliaceum, Strain CCMP 1326" /LENGTH=60 /DNA_ID=CAMNT_0017439579 /DNA_START=95 /DNA_END=274 /DNA_ORIENTATION=-
MCSTDKLRMADGSAAESGRGLGGRGARLGAGRTPQTAEVSATAGRARALAPPLRYLLVTG